MVVHTKACTIMQPWSLELDTVAIFPQLKSLNIKNQC